MRISDWSSDVCSSDLPAAETDDVRRAGESHGPGKDPAAPPLADECARDLLCERAAGKRHRALAHCRERERDGALVMEAPTSIIKSERKSIARWRSAVGTIASGTNRDRKSTRLNSSH